MGRMVSMGKSLYFRRVRRFRGTETLAFLARLFRKLETSVSPLHPRSFLEKVYEPSLRKLLGASKKQNVQPPSRAGEKYGLSLLEKSFG